MQALGLGASAVVGLGASAAVGLGAVAFLILGSVGCPGCVFEDWVYFST